MTTVNKLTTTEVLELQEHSITSWNSGTPVREQTGSKEPKLQL